jgi:hypothetical protein
MDTSTSGSQDQAQIKRKRINTLNLEILAQFLAQSGVELYHLSETSLPSHMINVANKLYCRARKPKRRPATDGIDFEVFLYVLVFGVKRGVLKLPLSSLDQGLTPTAVKQLEVFWADQQLDETYAELDLQASAESACEDWRNAWHNLRSEARIIVSDQIYSELADELDQASLLDNDTEEVPNDDSGRETNQHQRMAAAQGLGEGPRSTQGQMLAGTVQLDRPIRRRTQFFPKGIPNFGNTCYKAALIQVLAC